MDFLKSIFGDKPLTYAELETALKDNKEIKLANLASGNYVDKEKFDKSELKAKGLETQLGEANNTIDGFKAMDIDTIKKSADDWKTKYDTDTKALTEKLIKQTLDSKIDFALTGAKAKNLTAVKALLKQDAISLDGENILGLNEQLATITKDNPYLFGDVEENPAPGGGATPPVTFTKEDIGKMSPSEINKNWDSIQKSL